MQTLKLFVLATIAASVVATAEKHAAEQVDDVVRTADGTVVGESSLYRFDNRIHAITRTSDFDPGSAATVWWRIYNRPRFCSVPFACEASDLEAQPQPRKIWPTEIWLREIWLRNLTRDDGSIPSRRPGCWVKGYSARPFTLPVSFLASMSNTAHTTSRSLWCFQLASVGYSA